MRLRHSQSLHSPLSARCVAGFAAASPKHPDQSRRHYRGCQPFAASRAHLSKVAAANVDPEHRRRTALAPVRPAMRRHLHVCPWLMTPVKETPKSRPLRQLRLPWIPQSVDAAARCLCVTKVLCQRGWMRTLRRGLAVRRCTRDPSGHQLAACRLARTVTDCTASIICSGVRQRHAFDRICTC